MGRRLSNMYLGSPYELKRADDVHFMTIPGAKRSQICMHVVSNSQSRRFPQPVGCKWLYMELFDDLMGTGDSSTLAIFTY